MITFTPLAGASESTPLSYLLQVDDVRILLDCGSPDWNPEDDEDARWEAYCKALEAHAPSVDLVLISHADLAHAGLFPYAYAHWNLRAPAYCTYPVQSVGRVTVLDEVEALRDEFLLLNEDETAEEALDEPPAQVAEPPPRGKRIASAKNVHDAFDSLNTLRYSQPTHLLGKCQGLTITPFAAGHSLGGTIWKIRSPSAGTIVYAVDLNHMRERHLDGTVLFRGVGGSGAGVFEPLARPDLLIIDANRTLVVNSRRKDRDAALLDAVTQTLNSHSLLLPVDSSSRLLELLVLFDQHWAFSRLRAPICLVSRTGAEMLQFIRSMMEWLGGTISKEDIGDEKNPGRKRKRDDEDEDAIGAFALRFRNLEIFPTHAAFQNAYPPFKPKLILAVPQNMSHGASRALFTEMASVPGNVLLMTSRGEEGTLARDLFDMWDTAQRADAKWGRGEVGQPLTMDSTITIKLRSKVPLQGAELDAHIAQVRATKERDAAQQAALARTQLLLEADDDSDSEESDSDAERDDAGGGDNDDQDGATIRGSGQKQSSGRVGDNWAFDVDEGTAKALSYDIYLKGSVARPTSFFKATEGQGPRFRMFPYVERKRRVDAYGEVVDVGLWLRKGKVLEEGAENDEVKEAKLRLAAAEEAKRLPPEPPSKFVTTEVDVKLSCRLFYVDMEGLNDSRAVKTMVAQVNPRKLIIVHASAESSASLVESCSAIRGMTTDIYTPVDGDSIQIGQPLNSFSLSISEELLASVKMSKFEDTEVGFIAGRITSHASSSIPVLEAVGALPVTQMIAGAPAPASRVFLGARALVKLPHSTMIGDLKLTNLRARLGARGIPAEFAGEGVLVCGAFADGPEADEVVAVRKLGRGKVVIEGTACETYYDVRREVYALHAIVVDCQ